MRPERWLYTVPLRLRALFRRRRVDQELEAELRDHIERKTEEYRAQGMAPDEARRQALLEMRGIEQTKERCRDTRGVNWLLDFMQDARYGLRILRKSPGFAAVAILTLALGIGANSAIFSIAYSVLFRPLPYANPSHLVRLSAQSKLGIGPVPVDIAEVAQKQASIFSQAAIYRWKNFILTGGAPPQNLSGIGISGDLFGELGVAPLLGRPLTPQDSAPDSDPVVVLGYSIWANSFDKDPKIIGRRLTLDETSYTVIGVMPPDFQFPFDGSATPASEGIWVPEATLGAVDRAQEKPTDEVSVIGRLRDGVTLDEARAQLHLLAQRIIAAHATANPLFTDLLAYRKGKYVGWLDSPLLILLYAAGFVLLIACVNVSGLLLARGQGRQGEMAIRTALGATRLRIVRQLLAESAILSLAGGVAAVLVSVWCVRAINAIAPPGTISPISMSEAGLGAPMLWFTLGVSVLAGLVFGLLPAIQASARRMGAGLKQNRPGAAAAFSERRPRHLRNALVVIEVALAVVLVTGAALMARSLEKIAAIRLGLRTDNVLTMNVNFSKGICAGVGKPKDGCIANLRQTIGQIEMIPGVESAAVSGMPPAVFGLAFSVRDFRINGGGAIPDVMEVSGFGVSPGYFRTMGIRLLAGRDFVETDGPKAPAVIINKTFAKLYLSGNPLGQRISLRDDKNGRPQWMQIIGLVADSRDDYFYAEPSPACYEPFAQEMVGTALVIRTATDPMALLPAIKQRIWSVDGDAPLTDIRTMQQVVSDLEANPRFHMALLGSFGVLGLLLAMIGAYGVISYTVAQRTHEIGVRIALGAEPRDVLGLVLREGMLLACIGIAIGIGGSLALTRLIRSFLFEVTPTDPVAFTAVAILLFLAALAACWIPARRATRVDPMVALRYE